MEKRNARAIPHWAIRFGPPTLAATTLLVGCASVSSAPNQPSISYVTPSGELYLPDGPATCSVTVKAVGRETLAVTLRLGTDPGVTAGTFTATADSIEEGWSIARRGGNIPTDRVDLPDPGGAAALINVTGWAQYGAAGTRSFACSTDFYPHT